MSSKIDLALELKGIASDTYNALKSYQARVGRMSRRLFAGVIRRM